MSLEIDVDLVLHKCSNSLFSELKLVRAPVKLRGCLGDSILVWTSTLVVPRFSAYATRVLLGGNVALGFRDFPVENDFAGVVDISPFTWLVRVIDEVAARRLMKLGKRAARGSAHFFHDSLF